MGNDNKGAPPSTVAVILMDPIEPALRILIIEDDPDTGMLIAEALTDRFGPNCATVLGSLAKCKEADLELFDVVLCDYHLPDGDGLAALRILLSRRPDLLVIMVTSEREVAVVMDAIRTGAYDYVVKSDEMFDLIPLTIEKNLEVFRIKRENTRLQQDLESSLERIQESNGQLAEMVRKLEAMAHTDALTGLHNRRHVNNSLDRMFAEATRYTTPLAAIMIDLDGFKQLNDSHGHQAGDDVLARLGRIITKSAREADLSARYGGDEFLLLMPQTDSATAAALVHRIRQLFNRAETTSGFSVSNMPMVTLSVGVACTSVCKVTDGEHLVSLADAALYAAKRSGKNRTMNCVNTDGKFVLLEEGPHRASA